MSLASVEAMTPHAWQKVLAKFPSLLEAAAASKKELLSAGLTEQQATELAGRPNDVSREMKLLQARNIRIVTLADPAYPTLLKEINDSPLWLFYRGQLDCLESQPTLTVVGTRKPSAYAEEILPRLLGADLLNRVAIVSGLAYGIDKIAHQLSLKAGGQTAAVLAGGLDRIYPADHTRLAEQIIEQGGVVLSEYPPLSRPWPYRFPVRNRILAGLSPLTLVVEAAIKSGTLTTAKSALDYNRDLMAIPADITRSNAEGGNFLIKRGAMAVDSAADLLAYYNIDSAKNDPLIDNYPSKILDLLSNGNALSVDDLVSRSGVSIDTILTELTELELSGLVYQVKIGYYQQAKK